MHSAPTVEHQRDEGGDAIASRATAFRVGYVVGESGRTVIDAYPEAGKLRSRYVEGIAWGKEQRFKRQDL